jgi:hypothetical protein
LQLEALWRQELAANVVLRRYRESGNHAHLHLDLIRGEYTPEIWDDGGGPDWFEVEIGNQLAYAAPMHEAGSYYRRLQAQWLPYYGIDLRRQRLEMVHAACAYDLEHVPFFVQRGLYFGIRPYIKSFRSFYRRCSFPRFTVSRSWIRMQVEEWLGLPDLYALLPALISVSNIESSELIDRAGELDNLLDLWAVDQPSAKDRSLPNSNRKRDVAMPHPMD